MIVYGYVKGTKYAGDGTLLIQVRIPSIHGPLDISEYQGRTVRNYTPDQDLPWYPSLILPYKPANGEVVAITTLDDSPSEWLILGMTGGSHRTNASPK